MITLTMYWFYLMQRNECLYVHKCSLPLYYLFLGHYFQIFQCVTGCTGLSFFGVDATALAYGHWQCGQLYKALTLSRIGFLININVSDLELLFTSDLLQELNIIDIRIAQTGSLKWKEHTLFIVHA